VQCETWLPVVCAVIYQLGDSPIAQQATGHNKIRKHNEILG